MDIVKNYFDDHSQAYAARVMDRQRWPHLDLEDGLIMTILEEKRLNNEAFSIIDAGCGTGDRLRHLLEKATLPGRLLAMVSGIDYSRAMLRLAAEQQYAGQKLYSALFEADLAAASLPNIEAELVLSLWGVVNTGAMNDLPKTLSNLAALLTLRGQLIFDVRTKYGFSALKEREAAMLRDNPPLPPLLVPAAAWHRRADGTFGAMKYLTATELTSALASSGLVLRRAWGYHHRSSEAMPVTISQDGLRDGIDEHFPFLLCVAERKSVG